MITNEDLIKAAGVASLDELRAFVKRETLEFQKRWYPEGGEEVETSISCSEKGEKILSILEESEFDEWEEGLVKVLALLIQDPDLFRVWKKKKEEEDSEEERTFEIPQFVMVVPLENFNSHNYPLGKPTLFARLEVVSPADRALRADRTQGNHLLPALAWNRPATPEEIDSFFDLWSLVKEDEG